MALGRQFVVRVDGLQKLNKKFKDIEDYARFRLPGLTKQQAKEGAQYAANIAPKRTGALIQGIQHFQGKGRSSWEIVSRQPKARMNKSYHLWMHDLGRYQLSYRNYRGKDPYYMFHTYDYLKGKYPEIAKKELDKTLRK